MHLLTVLTSWIARLDHAIRHFDFRVSRTVGGPFARWGISRHTWAAVILPAAIAFFFVNGPALRLWPSRLLIAVLVALLAAPMFLAALRIGDRRAWPIWADFILQLGLLGAIGATSWFVGGPVATERDGGVYRHLYVPLVAVVTGAGCAAALLAALLFRSLAARATLPHRLTVVELFVSPPTPQAPAWGMLGVAAIGVITSATERLLLPPALAILFVPRTFVRPVFAGLLVANLVLLAFASLDRRFDAAWDIPSRLVFRGWTRLWSWVVIAIGVAWLLDFQYVSTVLDGSRNHTIVGIVMGAYLLFWWHDYWTSTFVAFRLLDVLGRRHGSPEARIPYAIRDGYPATHVEQAGRVLQSHGAGRLIVIGAITGRHGESAFQLYEAETLLEALADGLPPRHRGRSDIDSVHWRLRAHFLLAAVVLAVLGGLAAWQLHALPQLPHITARSTSAGALDAGEILFPEDACRPGQAVIALSASGGGTRAALYTASVLERLHRRQRLHRVRLVSGVSGGGAALAYFAAHRRELLDAPPDSKPWTDYFERMKEAYIEDVIDGAGEWRMVANDRLGSLLAESFERHWSLGDNDTMSSVHDLGLILNTALAGRFLRADTDPPEMSLGELERESGRDGLSDVAGGRLVFTNMALPPHFDSPGLFRTRAGQPVDTRDARLPVIVVSDGSVKLADAAAANANFPPVFSNAPIDVDGSRRYWITDGGAVDNRGLETLLYTVRHALARVPGRCATLPAVHIVEVEASAFSDGYRQDRGVGSVMAAGSAFASQLDSELLQSVSALASARKGSVQFHYLPMPAVLRRAGSLGTHWMLQKRVTVCLDPSCERWPPWRDRRRVLTGDDVLTILRALDGTQLPGSATPATRDTYCVAVREEHTNNWTPLREVLSAGGGQTATTVETPNICNGDNHAGT